MDATVDRAWELKQELIDFVLDAEGEVAIALETYAAEHASRDRADISQRNMRIDSFAVEGQVGNKTPIDLFLETQPDLSAGDRTLIQGWQKSFMGVFEAIQVLPDGLELMNWLTAKHYQVKANSEPQQAQLQRVKPGDILLTRIAPVDDSHYMFFGNYMALGNLGKPKLAVAIGNFKDNYKNHLYGDAPELLEEAWESVAKYHEEFTEFFGSDNFTLPGYQLNKKIGELQESMTKKRLAEAGIDENKSLEEVADEAGVDLEELIAAAEEAGMDPKEAAQVFDRNKNNKMVMPKVHLPDDLKKAEEVTCFSHPRWGQMLIPTYGKFVALLNREDPSIIEAEPLVRHYLEDPIINFYVWQQLAAEYPTPLENILQLVLERPNFQLDRDLGPLLQEFNKPLEPHLPETASIPLHLNQLFEEALVEVNKSKSKSKGKKKASKGFLAS